MSMVSSIFVYGTLKKGFERYFVIEPFIKKRSKGYIKGKLYDTPYGFPVVFEDEGIVYGEYYEVSNIERVLKGLDYIEGYSKRNKEASLYYRKIVDVFTEDGEKKAYVYFGNKRNSMFKEDKLTFIPEGEWK